MEANEALDLAADGSAPQLIRARAAVNAAEMASLHVVGIEMAIADAAALVTALGAAGTAATAYDVAKADYDAVDGMTQANLDALTEAATATKEAADAALTLAADGSAADLIAAQAAVAAATTASDAVDDIVTALQTGIDVALTAHTDAIAEHTAAKKAHDDDASLGNANALKTAAEAVVAKAMTAHEKGVLGASAAQLTALESVSITDAETDVATADTAVTTAQTAAGVAKIAKDAAAVVAATEAAKTKTTAIAEEADQLADAGLGGELTSVALEERAYSMEIERTRDGTKVTIADTGMAGEDDPKFMQAMDLGGGRTMHVRTMDADDGDVVEEVVVVRTDIEAPKATAFATVDGQALNAHTDTTNDDPTVTFEALAVDENSAGVLALVKSDAFAADTVATLTFPDNDTSTMNMDEAFEAAGTYNGADGTYRCNGTADCTVTLDADGMITAMSDGWVFTPDAGATSDVADADYLNYGFWLMRTTDEDGEVTYNEVETFAGSSIPASGSVTDVDGSATYEGDATGVYVKNVYTPSTEGGQKIDYATSGHFTADAELKAYFGQVPVSDTDTTGTIAPNLLNTVTGTINNFELSGGEANAWAVNLTGDIDVDAGTASGAANGGGAAGTFNATFHGSTAAFNHDGDATTAEINCQPSSVVGEFDANFSNGSVAGGFGARK